VLSVIYVTELMIEQSKPNDLYFLFLPKNVKTKLKNSNVRCCFVFILLVTGIFCLELQLRSWLSVIILKVNIKVFLHVT
jgi:hypothetical protein